jgi:hypothetical protein
MVCVWCTSYHKQIALVDQAMARVFEEAAHDLAEVRHRLSDDARTRIARSIDDAIFEGKVMRKVICYTCLLLAGMLAVHAGATTINVPADQPTIQAGIDIAVDFDTVLVAPGTYYENIIFRGEKIVLTSYYALDNDPSYIYSTIINGSSPSHPDSASVVRIVDYENAHAILQGFTITGGTGTVWTDEHGHGVYREGGGILCANAGPTIKYNLIIHNRADDDSKTVSAGGGGIRIGDGLPNILNNVIMYNRGRYGAGIVLNYSAGILRNNVIAYNTGGEDFSGSGVWKYAGQPALLENNTIYGNESELQGAGVWIAGTSMIMRNNIIWGNVAPSYASVIGWGSSTMEYNNIEGGYAGEGNIEIDPQLAGTFLYPNSASPCVDAGDPLNVAPDPPDPLSISNARWPALGATACDMGAYGGAGSRALELVAIAPDITVGEAPLSVQFSTLSYHSLSGWDWDFGDSNGSTETQPQHTYTEAGVYYVDVTVDTGGGIHHQSMLSPIIVLADTLSISSDTVRPNSEMSLSISLRNNVPITSLTIPLLFAGDFELQYDSVSTVGCRTEYFESIRTLDKDLSDGEVTVQLTSSFHNSQPELPIGEGDVLKVHFTTLSATVPEAVTPVLVSGYEDFEVSAWGSVLQYSPEVTDGEIVSLSCCVGGSGNVDGDPGELIDIGDLTAIISYLYIPPNTEPECLAEANIDGDLEGLVDIGDLTAMISYLYIPPNLPPAACQ